MMAKRVLRKVMVSAAFLMALAGPAIAADTKPKVVATFTIIGDLVEAVGGDAVSVTTLVGPDGDAHVFEPRPSDVAAVAQADLIVANGLGMEPWLARLTEAADFKGKTVIASADVTPLPFKEEADSSGTMPGRPARVSGSLERPALCEDHRRRARSRGAQCSECDCRPRRPARRPDGGARSGDQGQARHAARGQSPDPDLARRLPLFRQGPMGSTSCRSRASAPIPSPRPRIWPAIARQAKGGKVKSNLSGEHVEPHARAGRSAPKPVSRSAASWSPMP